MQRASIGPWPAFGILYLIGLVGAAALGMIGPLVGQIAADFHVSVAAVGAVLLALFLPGALLGAAIGGVVDRVGARTVLLAAALLLALIDGLQVIAPSLVLFGAGLFVLGGAVTAILSSGQVMVTAAFPGVVQARALTIWSTVNFTGYAAGLLVAAAVAAGPGWRGAFAAHGAASVAVALAALALPRPARQAAWTAGGTARARSHPLGLFKEIGVLRVSLAMGLASVAGVGTNTAIALYLHDAHNAPLSVTASAAALGNVICILGGLGSGWLMGRGVSPVRLALAICLVAGLSGAALYTPWITFPAAIALLYLYQICLSAITGVVYATLPRLLVDQSRIGAASGLVVQIGGLGAMLGPTLFFAVLAMKRWDLLALIIAALWTASLVLFPKRGHATPDAPDPQPA